MIEGEDVLMRPVLRGMLRFESLLDGTVDLAQVLLCNEAMDIEAENERRFVAYEKRRRANEGKSHG
jgi:hypothetical protein